MVSWLAEEEGGVEATAKEGESWLDSEGFTKMEEVLMVVLTVACVVMCVCCVCVVCVVCAFLGNLPGVGGSSGGERG